MWPPSFYNWSLEPKVRGTGLRGVAAHPAPASACSPRPGSPCYRARCLKRRVRRARRGVVRGEAESAQKRRSKCAARSERATRFSASLPSIPAEPPHTCWARDFGGDSGSSGGASLADRHFPAPHHYPPTNTNPSEWLTRFPAPRRPRCVHDRVASCPESPRPPAARSSEGGLRVLSGRGPRCLRNSSAAATAPRQPDPPALRLTRRTRRTRPTTLERTRPAPSHRRHLRRPFPSLGEIASRHRGEIAS